MKKSCALFLLFYMFFLGQLMAQNEVKFGTGLLRQCNGILKSSEQGQTTGHYAHDENLVMTICVPGSASMQWDFKQFCTEKDYDVLKIYRGKDTLGSLLGVYSGLQGPGAFSVSDSCITFHFISDGSVACFGWEAMWQSQIVSFPPPAVQLNTSVSCGLTSFELSFDYKFLCNQILPSHLVLTGPKSVSVVNVQPLDCNADSLSSRYQITFASPLDRGGTYRLEFTIQEKDLCDSLWTWTVPLVFSLTDCPIEVKLLAADTLICKGTCIQLMDSVSGGNESNYIYNWFGVGLSGKGPHLVCPTSDILYKLEVSDGVSISGSDSVFIRVVDPPLAGNDTSVCQSSPPFYLQASPTGGVWEGGSFITPDGLFSPALSGQGLFKPVYRIGKCVDTLAVNVRPISAGAPQASCPQAAPFLLSGFSPSGGYWTGSKVDSLGWFSPDSSGQFRVTYHWGTCQADKWVYVDSIQLAPMDTTCLTDEPFLLNFSPPGGRWSGPGITQTVLGRFSPAIASFGSKDLVYTLNGCRDTQTMFVKRIQTNPPIVVCPQGGMRLLPAAFPVGGYWTGTGIVYPDSAYYNAAHLLSNSWDSVVYHADGCEAKQYIQAITTKVITDSLLICGASGKVNLASAVVSAVPIGGVWQGVGVVGNEFDPQVSGPGVFFVYYLANDCVDSLKIRVMPRFVIQSDTTVCGGDYIFNLYASETGGRWQGPGIVAPFTGGFNPKIAGVGPHSIQFINARGCRDTLQLLVESLPSILLTKQPTSVCSKDTFWQLLALPDTGFFYGNGVQGTTFNPTGVGANKTRVYYQVGQGVCSVKDSFEIQIIPPLSLELLADKDSVCKFGTVGLQATPKGGLISNYRLTWSNGITNTDAIFVFPDKSAYYIVTLQDNCSDAVSDSVWIAVAELPGFNVITNLPLCKGAEGFAINNIDKSKPYKSKWFVQNQIVEGDTLFASVGNVYRLELMDTLFACSKDTLLRLPVHPNIKADFRLNSDAPCMRLLSPFLPLIDLSEGGVSGVWKLEPDGTTFPYLPSTPPVIPINPLNTQYRLLLEIESLEGCRDTQAQSFCIIDTVFVHIPTAFSPNQDGLNDLFAVSISHVRTYRLEIYNRWGEKVFESDNPDAQWDGTYQGHPCVPGYYAYRLFYQSYGTFFKSENGMLYLLR
jgi:gliding motility-associated-like protein